MSTDTRVLDVIETIYDAAMDENQWSHTLQKLIALTGSQAATFWVLDSAEKPRLPVFTCINLDPAFVADYQDHMVPHDPTIQYLVSHPRQPIVHDGLVITEREKDHHSYYDWHHRYSDLRFRLVSQMRPAQSVQAGIALHRTRKIGRYEQRDIEQFTVLHRHIERALAIGFRLGSLGTMQQCTTELLDRNPAAILFMDEHRRSKMPRCKLSALNVWLGILRTPIVKVVRGALLDLDTLLSATFYGMLTWRYFAFLAESMPPNFFVYIERTTFTAIVIFDNQIRLTVI